MRLAVLQCCLVGDCCLSSEHLHTILRFRLLLYGTPHLYAGNLRERLQRNRSHELNCSLSRNIDKGLHSIQHAHGSCPLPLQSCHCPQRKQQRCMHLPPSLKKSSKKCWPWMWKRPIYGSLKASW